MVLNIENRPTVVDQNGMEITMGQTAFVIVNEPLQMALSVGDIRSRGNGVEVKGIGEHIAEIVTEVLNCGNPTMIQNMYRDIGGALRCITSEENARTLISELCGELE